MARRFAKVSEEEIKTAFFYLSDLVNTKTTIPLRVGEERRIHTSKPRVSVYIHHYSSPPRGIVVYYSSMKPELLALYWAVTQTYRDLLIGSKFVYTDNNFLSYLQTTARLGEDDIRWAAYLARSLLIGSCLARSLFLLSLTLVSSSGGSRPSGKRGARFF